MPTLDLGTLRVKLTADTKQYDKGMAGAEKSTIGLADGINLALGGVAVNALQTAGTAMLKFGMDSITAASDAEEAWSKFATVFKGDAADVEAQLNAIAESSGLSTNQLVGFASTLGDTFVPLGFTTAAAGDLSSQVTQLAADLASFNNLNTADVVRDFQSALVGNVETLRKYGIVANQAIIEQEALNAGLWSGTGAISAQAKAAAILNIAMAGTTDAQGDAARTAEGFANQSKALEASILDLQVELGQGLLPVAIDLVDWLGRIADDAMPAVKAATGDYEATISDMIAVNLEAADTLGELGEEFLKMKKTADISGAGVLGFKDDIEAGMGDAAVKMLVMTDTTEELQQALKRAGISEDDFGVALGDLDLKLGEIDGELTHNIDTLREYALMTLEAEGADRVLIQSQEDFREANKQAIEVETTRNRLLEQEALNSLDLSRATWEAKAATEAKTAADEAAALAAAQLAVSTEEARLALSGYFVEALTATEPTASLAMQLFNAADAANADAAALAVLAAATGEFTAAEIEAAFNAALMRANIDELVGAMMSGAISAETAAAAVQILGEKEGISAAAAIAFAGALDAPNAALHEMGQVADDVTTAIGRIPTTVTIGFRSDLSQFNVPAGFSGQQGGQGGGAAEFAMGGFTGGGSGIAGLVHANEFVFSPPAVAAIGLPALSAMHDMAKGGGLSQAGGVSVGEMNINAAPGMDEQQLARAVNVELGTLLRQSTRSGAGLTGLG